MDRRVISPTWGPPPPCKQALRVCNNSANDYIIYLVERQDFITILQSYLGNTLASATFKYFENKNILKPWMKLRNVTTFDAYGFYVRDRFGMLFEERSVRQ